MSISELRDDVQRALADFLWDEWAQMGVSASTKRRDSWAIDPEALLLLTFEVGRGDPRLFEEVLDWMLVNERLLSVQRLRNLVVGDEDRRLVEAVLGWLGQNRRRTRLKAKPGAAKGNQPFFRESRLTVSDPDAAFLAQGFLKPRGEPSGKSGAPDVRLPINLAFRLRLLLGVSVRAEVVRALLSAPPPWTDAQAVAASTAYAKRNVQAAIGALDSAEALSSRTVGNVRRLQASERWDAFLELKERPPFVDWPHLSHTFRRILRWLVDADQERSDYMTLSSARTLLEELDIDPRSAGEATEDFAGFEGFVRNVLAVDV